MHYNLDILCLSYNAFLFSSFLFCSVLINDTFMKMLTFTFKIHYIFVIYKYSFGINMVVHVHRGSSWILYNHLRLCATCIANFQPFHLVYSIYYNSSRVEWTTVWISIGWMAADLVQ